MIKEEYDSQYCKIDSILAALLQNQSINLSTMWEVVLDLYDRGHNIWDELLNVNNYILNIDKGVEKPSTETAIATPMSRKKSSTISAWKCIMGSTQHAKLIQ